MRFSTRKKCLIIAEISSNHGGNLNRALNLIKKAKQAGVDAVKFQLYTPDSLTIDANNKYFRIKHPKWGGQTLYQLYQKAYTPRGWFKKLKKAADDLGILFFATAFDKKGVDFLEDLNVAIHKIASFELVDLPLIEYAARTKKPLILSCGMATIKEIKEALCTARDAGVKEAAILKCVSSYPANPKEMNLKTIPFMEKQFKCPIGLSDHTKGVGVSVAGVVLGAKLIEKHFTLSRKINTLDGFFSLEPQELNSLVKNIRMAEDALGKIYFGLTKEQKNSKLYRRSLFAVKDIRKGEVFTGENIRSIRPSSGLKPKYLTKILGKRVKRDIKRGTPLTMNMV